MLIDTFDFYINHEATIINKTCNQHTIKWCTLISFRHPTGRNISDTLRSYYGVIYRDNINNIFKMTSFIVR